MSTFKLKIIVIVQLTLSLIACEEHHDYGANVTAPNQNSDLKESRDLMPNPEVNFKRITKGPHMDPGAHWEDVPKKNLYEYFRKMSVAENLRIFELYEEQISPKVINACLQGFKFSIAATWDLEIKNQQDALDMAIKNCNDFSSVILLGYSAENEFKF